MCEKIDVATLGKLLQYGMGAIGGTVINDQDTDFHAVGEGGGTGIFADFAQHRRDIFFFVEDRHGHQNFHCFTCHSALQFTSSFRNASPTSADVKKLRGGSCEGRMGFMSASGSAGGIVEDMRNNTYPPAEPGADGRNHFVAGVSHLLCSSQRNIMSGQALTTGSLPRPKP